MNTLSVVMITKNAEEILGTCLQSIEGLWSELLLSDDSSTDETVKVAKSFGANVFSSTGTNLGNRKQLLINKSKGDWILVLDSDEQLSDQLRNEIKNVLESKKYFYQGYRISYQNYIFGQPLYYGGEKYSKIRLFKRGSAKISPLLLHEEIDFVGSLGRLKGVILHNSYRSLDQIINKFTKYASVTATQKARSKEAVTFKKLFLYGPHMFWARYVKDQGWRDGWRGLVLALLFSYMEGLTYWLLLSRKFLPV